MLFHIAFFYKFEIGSFNSTLLPLRYFNIPQSISNIIPTAKSCCLVILYCLLLLMSPYLLSPTIGNL